MLASRSEWDDPEVLWSSLGDYRRLVLPWNWQLPQNNCRPVTQFDLSWGKTSLRSYGIEAGSYWAVLTPEASTLGLATNNQELAEDLSFSFGDGSLSPKELYFRLSEHRLRIKRASASEVCPDDYKFWFVLTDDPEETRSYLRSWMFFSDRHKGKNVRDTIILTQGPSN